MDVLLAKSPTNLPSSWIPRGIAADFYASICTESSFLVIRLLVGLTTRRTIGERERRVKRFFIYLYSRLGNVLRKLTPDFLNGLENPTPD
jgi:hypothetical protein